MKKIPGFSIDKVAAAAGSDPDVLRMENLDTDLKPPALAIEATRAVVGYDAYNSYLPFTGQLELREAIAERLRLQSNHPYEAEQVIVTCGATEAMLDTLLTLYEPDDEVILTDPTYAGMIGRVRMTGAVPKLIPWVPMPGQWRLDLEALRKSVSFRTRAIFLMNPSMPTGAVMNLEEWNEVRRLCLNHDIWLIYNAAMERILYDNRQLIHPAALDGMAEKTIIIGSVSKEFCMIGWRVGWIAAPAELVQALSVTHIHNVVSPVGITQAGALAALLHAHDFVSNAVAIWEERRNVLVEQLAGWNSIPAAGGWSQLLDISSTGLHAEEASRRLLEFGKIAATPMTHWGYQHSDQYLRLVFSNEPKERLATVGHRLRAAFS